MFCIDTGSLKLKLQVVPVDSLVLHEEVFPRVVEELKMQFKNWANLQNPVIVDENHIVLDGNHRTTVFKELHFKYMPVCKIDYFSEAVRLRYWFRRLERIAGLNLIENVVRAMGGEFVPLADKGMLKSHLQRHQLCCGIQQGGCFAAVQFPETLVNDAVGAYAMVEEMQARLVRRGAELSYVPCQSVMEGVDDTGRTEETAAVWTPQITKEMVVDAAQRKKAFAPKATRHLIPARPLNVNVPARWFRENATLDDIDRRFSAFLEKKGIKRFGPGQIIGGRYYEEELFVFFDRGAEDRREEIFSYE